MLRSADCLRRPDGRVVRPPVGHSVDSQSLSTAVNRPTRPARSFAAFWLLAHPAQRGNANGGPTGGGPEAACGLRQRPATADRRGRRRRGRAADCRLRHSEPSHFSDSSVTSALPLKSIHHHDSSFHGRLRIDTEIDATYLRHSTSPHSSPKVQEQSYEPLATQTPFPNEE